AVNGPFCEKNLRLLFTLLRNAHAWEPTVRSNIIIAVGDLAFRFPNAVEPWTEHIYGTRASRTSLHDPCAEVRRDALLVLTHLILNDMMKVKGYISEMVLLLEDPELPISNLARLFVHELARKPGNPVYNLLPDLLSRLSTDAEVTPAMFRRIMTLLLSKVDKDKQAESLTDRLLSRFSGVDVPQQWRDIAFCLANLPMSEKSLRKMQEAFKSFKHTLHDDEVAESFMAACAKGKKVAKGESKAVRDVAEALEKLIKEQRMELEEELEEEGMQASEEATPTGDEEETTETLEEQEEGQLEEGREPARVTVEGSENQAPSTAKARVGPAAAKQTSDAHEKTKDSKAANSRGKKRASTLSRRVLQEGN
ncbi:hypothetical protein CYMTET_4301, partial [Cymbomonas tetramitiformis]